VATPKTKHATYADIEALPPNVVGEILFGSLQTHPRPAPRHAAAASRMGGILSGPFDFGNGGPGGWIILDEPELHLGPHVVVPDLAGWKSERLVGKTDSAWIDVPPDWICEVLSPSTNANDIGPKRRIYATYGVSHLWYVDPLAQTLEVFSLQGKDWLLLNTFVGAEEVRVQPFEAIAFPLSLLWPFDKPIKPQEF
jgi:Putative restriction endonuclease